MAFNCCSNCLPLLLEYHSSSLDLERKLQMQVRPTQKIELSKLQFEKQIRDLASSTFTQLTAPETPSKQSIHPSRSSSSPSSTPESPKPEAETPKLAEMSFDLLPDKENSLKQSLNDLKSSLSSLLSSAELFSNSVSSLKQSSDWKYSNSKGKDDSLFSFQDGFNNLTGHNNETSLIDSKKSSLMSPLRESDLKNSKETSSGLRFIEKPHGTPVSDILEMSDKPSSSFNKAFLTLDELQISSSGKKLFEIPEFKS